MGAAAGGFKVWNWASASETRRWSIQLGGNVPSTKRLPREGVMEEVLLSWRLSLRHRDTVTAAGLKVQGQYRELTTKVQSTVG